MEKKNASKSQIKTAIYDSIANIVGDVTSPKTANVLVDEIYSNIKFMFTKVPLVDQKPVEIFRTTNKLDAIWKFSVDGCIIAMSCGETPESLRQKCEDYYEIATFLEAEELADSLLAEKFRQRRIDLAFQFTKDSGLVLKYDELPPSSQRAIDYIIEHDLDPLK